MLDIIQGEKQPWSIDVETLNKTTGKTRPLDLTGFAEITVCFKTGVNKVSLTETGGRVTVDNAILGEISGFLNITETAGMPETEDGLTEVVVDFGGDDIRKSKISGSHRVEESDCP